ncbi:MerR family transcriptional regulator [Clostridium sp. CTA-7]
MSDKYTLKEVTELFNIPKSTLRFWEKKGIINPNRNDINAYREYTKKDLLKISDILYYRFTNYSIKSLRNIETFSLEEKEILLKEMFDEIIVKKNELQESENRVEKELSNVYLLKEMMNGVFHHTYPNFNKVYHLHMNYKDNVLKYTNNHHLLATVFSIGDDKLEHFGIISSKESANLIGEVLWDINEIKCKYIPFLLKVADRKIDIESIQAVLAEKSKEIKLGRIIARFLMNDSDYSYYQAWIELV